MVMQFLSILAVDFGKIFATGFLFVLLNLFFHITYVRLKSVFFLINMKSKMIKIESYWCRRTPQKTFSDNFSTHLRAAYFSYRNLKINFACHSDTICVLSFILGTFIYWGWIKDILFVALFIDQ